MCSWADAVYSLHSMRAVAYLMNTRHAIKLSAISKSQVLTREQIKSSGFFRSSVLRGKHVTIYVAQHKILFCSNSEYAVSHNAAITGEGNQLGTAVVELRVEAYLLDKVQTTADPLCIKLNKFILTVLPSFTVYYSRTVVNMQWRLEIFGTQSNIYLLIISGRNW